jgi:hypothetical protein
MPLGWAQVTLYTYQVSLRLVVAFGAVCGNTHKGEHMQQCGTKVLLSFRLWFLGLSRSVSHFCKPELRNTLTAVSWSTTKYV